MTTSTNHTIDTRFVYSGPDDDGHFVYIFDLVLDGSLHAEALTLHVDGDRRQIYIAPKQLRDWIEDDHTLLHEVGAVMWRAYRDMAEALP